MTEVIEVETEAEAYCILAMRALPHSKINQGELRAWWRQSTIHRQQLRLTPEQEERLTEFCRNLIWQLPEGEAPDTGPTPGARQPRPRKPPRRY